MFRTIIAMTVCLALCQFASIRETTAIAGPITKTLLRLPEVDSVQFTIQDIPFSPPETPK